MLPLIMPRTYWRPARRWYRPSMKRFRLIYCFESIRLRSALWISFPGIQCWFCRPQRIRWGFGALPQSSGSLFFASRIACGRPAVDNGESCSGWNNRLQFQVKDPRTLGRHHGLARGLYKKLQNGCRFAGTAILNDALCGLRAIFNNEYPSAFQIAFRSNAVDP